MKTKQLSIPSVEQLETIYNSVDSTTKAWICCQKDSGLSTLDLLSLNLKQINNQLNSIPLRIEIYHKMVGSPTNTFFGSNAIDALEKYLVNRNTEQLFDIRQKIICNRLKKLDLSPYALRKFFYRKMVKAQVPKVLIEYWMGHIELTQRIDISVEQMKRTYMRAYSYIDISKKH